MTLITRLLRQIKEEDSEPAFRQLFDLQYDRLFRLSYYFLQNDEWAKEVALDVLADVWNERHRLPIPDDFERYSWTMVRNASLDLWRKEQRFQHDDMADGEASAALPIFADDTAATMERDELFRVYEEALAALPERCRAVWQLVKEDGLSYADVAAQLDISPKTVDAQLQKAVKHLRAAVGEYLERENGASASISPMRMALLSMLCL